MRGHPHREIDLAVSMQNEAVSLAMLMKACDRVGSALARDVLL